jgi:hypothetical protein
MLSVSIFVTAAPSMLLAGRGASERRRMPECIASLPISAMTVSSGLLAKSTPICW